MKYYSYSAVRDIVEVARRKWLLTTCDSNLVPANKRFLGIRKFRHVHSFILHLLDFIGEAKELDIPENERLEIIMK
jgi:hypothetical protein